MALLALLPLACQVASNPVDPASADPAECRISFDPQEALLTETADAAERWSRATGCTLDIAEGGVHVQLWLRIDKADGSQAPGSTSEDLRNVYVHAQASQQQRARTVMHEICHVVGIGGDHVDTDGVCSGRPGRRDIIDAASLEAVCAHLPCLAFVPEG